MKIKYEFLTGEAVEIEVSEAISKVLIGIDEEVKNSDRRESRRHHSIDALAEIGVELAATSEELADSIEMRETTEALRQAIGKLLPQQRKLLQKLYFGDGRTIVDVAREEGVTISAISHRLDLIYKKLRKLLNQNQ
ncbi:RNA polymerase sigma factor (sigma-70 family) [Anaerospora hongkongensis]|uniref:RNA polymerase sigma factor (Sigma-70 family) n=1 Tax=Anaerospora hongkongensis TaxID=244830 RepID=A0A4R1PZV5_9FIRM|nr:sigma-70 family RNA polymerase sigma factor [Anaerospora hongkongensis]TCL37221.1 RNA polymerase sigma factor (sigma-70 family) [Anaerospora hongkongensis]